MLSQNRQQHKSTFHKYGKKKVIEREKLCTSASYSLHTVIINNMIFIKKLKSKKKIVQTTNNCLKENHQQNKKLFKIFFCFFCCIFLYFALKKNKKKNINVNKCMYVWLFGSNRIKNRYKHTHNCNHHLYDGNCNI